MPISAAYPRDLAVRVLTRVLSRNEPLDEVLASVSGEITAPGARGWLQDICSGTLRWKGRLDYVIDSNALHKKPSGWLRKILLVASYQLIVQERVQASRVVSETVDEVRRKEGEAPAKFSNAILRKIAEHAMGWRNLELKGTPTLAQSAAWASLPPWIWASLEAEQGRDWLCRFSIACLERPTLWLRSKNPERVTGFGEPGPIPQSFRVTGQTPSGPVVQWPGFADGEFFVQDISSQTLVHEITQEVSRELGRPDFSALDLCAAPGGKSVGLSWSGVQVTASDRDEPRLALLRQTTERVAPGVKVVEKAAVAGLPVQDFVWVDAPCSGSGIIRRHPDVRWLKEEKEIRSLNEVQEQLIKEGWEKVRPGGFLAYSVCSVLKKEGPGLVKRAGLDSHIVKTWFLVPQDEPRGDGFWCALLKKS